MAIIEFGVKVQQIEQFKAGEFVEMRSALRSTETFLIAVELSDIATKSTGGYNVAVRLLDIETDDSKESSFDKFDKRQDLLKPHQRR